MLDYHTQETFPNLMDAVNQFREGLARYRHGKWDPAIEAFREAQRLNPGDKLPALYIERCEHLKNHPPVGEWNGVWVMTER